MFSLALPPLQGFMAEDHWSGNEEPVRFSERPTGGV